jgi:hypothetical protein
MAGLAAGLVLAFTLVPTSAALAQDGPEVTITNLAAAIEAGDTDVLPTFFCPEQAWQAAQFDVSTMVAGLAALGLPEGVDPSTIAAGIRFVPEIVSADVVSQTDAEAVVSVVGSISVAIDPVALSPLIEAMLTAQGIEVTPDMIEMMSGMMVGQLGSEPIDISDEITLVPSDTMPWVICDELGGGSEPSASPSADPSLVPAG